MALGRLLALVACFAAAGCFKVHESPCSYACGPNGACPTDYQCLADGYCHKNGDTSSCGYPDLAPED
jgi:hypothetical protein